MSTHKIFQLSGKRVWVAGHKGMVGSAILRRLQQVDCKVLTASRTELDLCNQSAVDEWLKQYKPEVIFLAAAKVGGILANSAYPADFLYQNLVIESNIIHSAWQNKVDKLMFLGSSCIYPKNSPEYISEDLLLTGELEETNEWYAIAKIAGIKLCQAYRKQYGCDFNAVMPTNLYGPNDNFDLASSHVLPALIAKFTHAVAQGLDTVNLWGSGKPRREFLHVDDLADALIFLMEHYSSEQHINIGVGDDVTILELAELIAEITGFQGKLSLDSSKPDGVMRKRLDVSQLSKLGWQAQIDLRQGIQQTVEWYLATQSEVVSP